MNSKKLTAFCWRSGLIQMAEQAPEGALVLASGPATLLAQTIDSIGRLSADNQSHLVPGVPEAVSDDAALDAVIDFQKFLNKRLSRALASTYGGDHASATSRI